jgi:antitoxin component YwqK of YwqJK toxin-antitoxin module
MDFLSEPLAGTHSADLFAMIVPIFQMTRNLPLPFTYANGVFTLTKEETAYNDYEKKNQTFYTLWTQHPQTGERHGFYLSWWSEDMSLTLAFYVNGLLHGTNYEWNANGNLVYQADHQNGQKNGWTYSYFPNGKTSQATYYQDGKRVGQETQYDEEGFITSVDHYGPNQALIQIQTWKKGQLLYVDNYPY